MNINAEITDFNMVCQALTSIGIFLLPFATSFSINLYLDVRKKEMEGKTFIQGAFVKRIDRSNYPNKYINGEILKVFDNLNMAQIFEEDGEIRHDSIVNLEKSTREAAKYGKRFHKIDSYNSGRNDIIEGKVWTKNMSLNCFRDEYKIWHTTCFTTFRGQSLELEKQDILELDKLVDQKK